MAATIYPPEFEAQLDVEGPDREPSRSYDLCESVGLAANARRLARAC